MKNLPRKIIQYILPVVRNASKLRESKSRRQSQNDSRRVDTKICYHIFRALQSNDDEKTTCLLRSHSAHIEMSNISPANECINQNIYINNGAGKNGKMLDLSLLKPSEMQEQVLLGLHAFTGNDHASSFFRNGKTIGWKTAKESEKYLTAFARIGWEIVVNENPFDLAKKIW